MSRRRKSGSRLSASFFRKLRIFEGAVRKFQEIRNERLGPGKGSEVQLRARRDANGLHRQHGSQLLAKALRPSRRAADPREAGRTRAMCSARRSDHRMTRRPRAPVRGSRPRDCPFAYASESEFRDGSTARDLSRQNSDAHRRCDPHPPADSRAGRARADCVPADCRDTPLSQDRRQERDRVCTWPSAQ